MRTVTTLCASSLGCSLGALGLVVARPEQAHARPRGASEELGAMTAVATYTLNADLASSFPVSTPQPRRLASEGDHGRSRPSSARVGQKRSLTPRARSSGGMPRTLQGDEDTTFPMATSAGRPQTFLRRLSSTMATSRDSSRTPTSRPGSAAISYSNGSLAFSTAGSTTPILPDCTSPSLPRNKLVKRTSSLRSTNGSPLPLSASRLPVPVLSRPATSHQRSATFQERLVKSEQSSGSSIDALYPDATHAQWRQYFTPRIAAGDFATPRRRGSTGIPNPIRRVYPDRRYTPTLISARELIRPALVESDGGLSDQEDVVEMDKLHMPHTVASSPLPLQTANFGDTSGPRRSFSIGDLLSTGPQPLWRRPSSSRGKTAPSKLVRKGKLRVASAPLESMGTVSSSTANHDAERPAKRRDLTDPLAAQRSIYSASSSTNPSESPANQDVRYRPDTTSTPSLQQTPEPLVTRDSDLHVPSPPNHGQHVSQSIAFSSPPTHPPRLSASRSEVPSTVGSDSESQSVGDNSTDYHSDTVWDSFPTRTTRSSSGRRGPHIENIFDDSPPTFSSDRSTKLRDFLNEGLGSDQIARYRYSTIEEEESVLNTPVRSVNSRSVTSTPSARPHASQVFSSSPPVMDTVPDPDDIDWDAPDDGESSINSASGIHNGAGMRANGNAVVKNTLFRFGPALPFGNLHSTDSTPQHISALQMDRTTLFDWAEHQSSPNHANHSPPRPRTVHGKKDQDSRGSRALGRRVPSTMHARSHSVPVVPDMDGKRDNVIANKFGTWGVGSKAVTEDWNEDFEFDDTSVTRVQHTDTDGKRIDSGHEMLVPRSIREQQHNVVANIELLREWGLVIEELKLLRRRAVTLRMLDGPYAQAWLEVDAMIELADQESEEHTLEPRRSPPSSPGFDYSAFEEQIAGASGSRRSSTARPDSAASSSNETYTTADVGPQTPSTITSRPRKDSELVAQNVIAALQAKRSLVDPPTVSLSSTSKKVPFDTATLRHIVPYIKGLKRQVKDALRETEGLYSSPRRRHSPESSRRTGGSRNEPAFRSIFNEFIEDDRSGDRASLRYDEAESDDPSHEQSTSEQSRNLTNRMQNMSLPP